MPTVPTSPRPKKKTTPTPPVTGRTPVALVPVGWSHTATCRTTGTRVTVAKAAADTWTVTCEEHGATHTLPSRSTCFVAARYPHGDDDRGVPGWCGKCRRAARRAVA